MMRSITFVLLLMFVTGAGVSAQSVKVNEPDVCYVCHEDTQQESSKKSQHTAFAGGKCSDCHNPHASRHATLLNDEVGELCISCHEDLKGLEKLASRHQPAANGECLSCHDPHASEFASVLTQPKSSLCQSCHPVVSDWLAKSRPHSPVAAKDCSRCHDAHGSTHKGILSKGVPQLCFDCHPQNAQFTSVHKGYNLTDADCSTCHDPHSSSYKGLLMANQHAPFESGDCAECHGSAAQSGGSFAISGDIEASCTNCHDDIKSAQKADYHPHLDAENSCTNCHNPHASNAKALLSSNQQTLCMKCHFTDVPVTEKTRYLTHADQDCSICHSPHGADNKLSLAKADDMALCRTCHADVHKGSHPMGDDVIDKRTGKTLGCLSCHKMHGSDQKFYLAFDPNMDLCIQCHKK